MTSAAIARTRSRPVSCGTLVLAGDRLLLGHATRSPRWDIPKGMAEPDEALAAAAARELLEETGLVAAEASLVALGVFPYLRDKDLALFRWSPATPPDPRALACASRFTARDGAQLPEFDRFGLFAWDEALSRVGKSLAQILGSLPPDIRRPV